MAGIVQADEHRGSVDISLKEKSPTQFADLSGNENNLPKGRIVKQTITTTLSPDCDVAFASLAAAIEATDNANGVATPSWERPLDTDGSALDLVMVSFDPRIPDTDWGTNRIWATRHDTGEVFFDFPRPEDSISITEVKAFILQLVKAVDVAERLTPAAALEVPHDAA